MDSVASVGVRMNNALMKQLIDELVGHFNAAMALAISGEPLLANESLHEVDYVIYRTYAMLGYDHPALIEAKRHDY
jgi:hypothetical protein